MAPDSADRSPAPPHSPSSSPKPVVVWTAIGLVIFSMLWALREPSGTTPQPIDAGPGTLSAEKVPLVTGDEPLGEMLTRAGCPVCHRIPGIVGANGQVGPPLVLGTTGIQRLTDSGYRGQAKTVHDYIVESVLDPERFVVPGYPQNTMPTWYGTKLSALALEKIASYLAQQTDNGVAH